jgi:prepilin-type N-terminal cleavage/methylation domain-containing protein
MRKQKGFSLIELLIVVAIILIIAAIAIPNLLRSRMAANEASAVGSVRTINTGQVTYAATYPNIGFVALANLGGAPATCATPPVTPAAACIIDNVLAGGIKSGYNLTSVPTGGTATATTSGTPMTGYLSTAIPATVGITGTRSFCSDQSGVIYFDPTGNIAATDAACVALTALQ